MAANIYAENEILHQTGVELVCLLYAEAITRLRRAIEELENHRPAQRAAAVGGAMAIIVELQATLDQEAGGQIAKDLARLYDYIQDRLLTGHAEQEKQPFVDATQVLESLLAGWLDCRDAMEEPDFEDAQLEVVAAGGENQRAWTL